MSLTTLEIEPTESVNQVTALYVAIVDEALAQIGERSLIPASEVTNILLDGRNILTSNAASELTTD